jgi:hypothetical protein
VLAARRAAAPGVVGVPRRGELCRGEEAGDDDRRPDRRDDVRPDVERVVEVRPAADGDLVRHRRHDVTEPGRGERRREMRRHRVVPAVRRAPREERVVEPRDLLRWRRLADETAVVVVDGDHDAAGARARRPAGRSTGGPARR